MITTAFNDGWQVRRRVGPFESVSGEVPAYEAVTLPHDAMLAAGRDPEGDPATAYYRAGAYEYDKVFAAPEEWRHRHVALRFEGVYRDAVVFVNGEVAARQPNGYREIVVPLDDLLRYGASNVVHVECRTGQDSRWYSGAGIYRDVWLHVADFVHAALDGVRVTTPDIGDDVARTIVDTTVANHTPRRTTVEIVTEIIDGDRVVATDHQPVTVGAASTARVRARLLVPSPRRWDLDDPHLYTCRITTGDDVTTTAFGIRSISADPRRGFQLNGRTVKLRGGCIHHDHGVLGAATFARAEERRVELLKAAGFNALRSAHQPASRPLLEACNRLGMLVMDETWDVWHDAKRDHDYAIHFAAQWEDDLEALVAKDHNHPSVVMYSIGNEIPEVGTPTGAVQGRAIVDRLRALDPTRLITNGVNLVLPLLGDDILLNSTLGETSHSNFTDERVAEITEESFAVLDIAGYNYGTEHYHDDGERFPNRVIVGTETFPRDIDRNWRLVQDYDHLIGDFTWTAWDYLGEVGLGRIEHDTDPVTTGSGLEAPFPWRYANCGDLDITGHRLPISYYREIVFGLRTNPFIAVRPPRHHNARKRVVMPWAWSSAVASWTWDGDEGRDVTIEVYAAGEEVELLQDDRSLGRRPVERHRARFETTYTPGDLVAVAYTAGVETGRSSLRSARGDLRLDVSLDREQFDDITFLTAQLVDAAGTVHTGTDREISVGVEGAAVLQGLSSAAPASDESFLHDRCTTYQGRAVGVIRRTGAGDITVEVRTAGCAPVSLTAPHRAL